MRNCPVFYRSEMSASTNGLLTPSSKPRRTVEGWIKNGIITQADIRSFDPVTVDDLYTAHDREYVDGVMSGHSPNRFGDCDEVTVANLLQTTGSMVAAALHVAEHGGVACSPTSGFHRAHHDRGSGFCTFNGLMLAAIKLDRMGKTVGIIDCDAHYGDGTQDIIDRLGLHHIRHYTLGRLYLPGRNLSMCGITEWTHGAVDNLHLCDVVLYQASADAYIDGPEGKKISLTELVLRDSIVFSGLKNVVWNLAGGYCKTAAVIHTSTLLTALGRM
jgi:acetoin utilization deacetylase AcuC-like enzyme